MLQHDPKTRRSHSQRVSHQNVVRTSTYLRTRKFPSTIVPFSFEKTVFTHISCRDDATATSIFYLLRLEIVGFTSSLAKPIRESVPLVTQRFDSRSKHVTKHTRLDCDDDARSSQARSLWQVPTSAQETMTHPHSRKSLGEKILPKSL